MPSSFRRNLVFFSAITGFIAAVIVFPRVGFFFEIAAREMRILWWLVLAGGIALYVALFFGRKR